MTGSMRMLLATAFSTVALSAPFTAQSAREAPYIRSSMPELFTYEELLVLGDPTPLPDRLQTKLARLTTTPFISNEAYYAGARPVRPNLPRLGRSLQVVFWNIERGQRLDDIKLLFTDREAFARKVAEARLTNAEEQLPDELRSPEFELELEADAREQFAMLRAQITALQTSDVIVVNELDWGMPRTGYREVVRELGEALNMNWAYGVEFVEVAPAVLGTETFTEVTDAEERAALEKLHTVDRSRLRALHGSAIFSRYPIRSATVTPFKEVGYDWFEGERNLPAPERAIRELSGLVGDKLLREVRRGGRMWLSVDLDVPDSPTRRLRVVSPHLENRAAPKARRAQMREVLDAIRDVPDPVIVAGDFNTTGTNVAPESFSRMARRLFSIEALTKRAVKYLTPVGGLYSLYLRGMGALHTRNDPTVAHVPIVAPNPERALFEMMEDFRFADGSAFDFRGEPLRSRDVSFVGTLANSNQRAEKGFVTTFDMGWMGKRKLDWIFVKASLEDPRDGRALYRFAPHSAWTLRLANMAMPGGLSDHHPMLVVLPFGEPDIPRVRARKPAPVDADGATSGLNFGTLRCGEARALMESDPGRALARILWAHGYLAGRRGLDRKTPPFTHDQFVQHSDALNAACSDPTRLWIDAVNGMATLPPVARGIATDVDLDLGRLTCERHLAEQDMETGLYEHQALWAHAYSRGHVRVDAQSGTMTVGEIVAFAERLVARCKSNPQQLWIDAVRALR